tara:strand:+ start:88 stop:468 length:381 start_codon:yes stop_codon:yes gene_type:complete
MGLLGLPRQGGLNASNYPNPYGLRAFQLPNDSYGGMMMPKTDGFQGIIKGLLGNNITEFSTGGVNNEPFYPLVTENLYDGQLDTVKKLEAGLLGNDNLEAQKLYEHALQEYLRRENLGLSAFKDLL